MKRHEFDPAGTAAGLLFLALAVAYFLDAAGAWNVPVEAAALFTFVGLTATGAVAAVNAAVRRSRRRGAAGTEEGEAELGDLPLDELRYDRPGPGPAGDR